MNKQEIKDTAARELNFKSFKTMEDYCYEGEVSCMKVFEILDHCIELAYKEGLKSKQQSINSWVEVHTMD